jgi:hypothetical protein
MLDPIRLDLTVSQVQGGAGLTRTLDPIRLDLTVSQVQDTWTW